MEKVVLNVQDVSCAYNLEVNVVKNISFKMNYGKKLCIAGPNGCGKTTLLRAIAKLMGYNGNIFFENKNLEKLKRSEISKNIAFMSQTTQIYFSYSIFDTVMLGRYLHSNGSAFAGTSKIDKEIVMSCLEDVGLADISDRQINTLSGGQLQRVYLARTFAQEPKLILLDEPTNHLDLKHQIELIEKINRWAEKDNHAVIGVFHDLNLTMNFADDIILMNFGGMVAYGSSNIILERELLQSVYGIDIKSYMQQSFKRWN